MRSATGGVRSIRHVRSSNKRVGKACACALHVLWERDRHRAGLGRVGKHTHRLRQRGEELLRPGDAVEEAADRPEAVVDADVGSQRVLEFLQDVALMAGDVVVGREQQHRQAVDGGRGGAGHHVGGAGADRAGTGQGGGPPRRLGVAGGDVHHRLLVARLIEREVGADRFQRLAEAADVAVAEDAEDGRHEARRRPAVALAVLDAQVLDDRLADGQLLGCWHDPIIDREASRAESPVERFRVGQTVGAGNHLGPGTQVPRLPDVRRRPPGWPTVRRGTPTRRCRVT